MTDNICGISGLPTDVCECVVCKGPVEVKVDTFVNYKDQSLAQRVQINKEVQDTVMRVREEQTVEALKMLGWHAPLEVPELSDKAILIAQDVYNITPVIFGERTRRMRAALIAAFTQHIYETQQAVERRTVELEAKFGSKGEGVAEDITLEPEPPIEVYVRPDGTWRVSGDDDFQQWCEEVDDYRVITVPDCSHEDLIGEVAQLAANGASQEVIDDAVVNWIGG